MEQDQSINKYSKNEIIAVQQKLMEFNLEKKKRSQFMGELLDIKIIHI